MDSKPSPKYAILDTETSGLFDYSKPADAEGQPRLASFAMICVDDLLQEFLAFDFLIQPNGWIMSPEAEKINGLSNDRLAAYGVEIKKVLDLYMETLSQGYTVAAFNAPYDLKVMRGELRRAQMLDLFDTTQSFCVMRALTDVCRVPRATGSGYKFPSLAQACAHFKIEQPAAHSAMGDANSVLELMRRMDKSLFPH